MTTRAFRCASALLLAFFPTTPVAASPFTPREWQGTTRIEGGATVTGKLVTWNRDRNRNFIDDLIDDRDPDEKLDIVVDFNRCVTCTDEGEEEILRFLRGIGKVDHVSRIVTFAVVLDVPRSELEAIAAREEVAMVEYLEPAQGMLNISAQAVAARAGALTPKTVEDKFFNIDGTGVNIDGTGVNIAILDSGVDNAGGPGYTHDMFPAGTIVGGADCVNVNVVNNECVLVDPDDDHGHGTHVAGIALGREIKCYGEVTCRGIAPGAGLVDIKVLGKDNKCVGGSCFRGLELAIDNRDLWSIDVVNVSFGTCTDSDGQNAAAHLINTAVSLGMVVAVAVGNAGDCPLVDSPALINDWASASLAITTAAVSVNGTAELGNDSVAGFSFRGPRKDDKDKDPRDELKPEISAPGSPVYSAYAGSMNGFSEKVGTSLAAAHVAGAAALALQAIPEINPGSVKELMINTAAKSGKPGPHPGHDIGWGFGFLDAFAMLDRAIVADVGRPTEPPYAPCSAGWCSLHISTATPPKLGVPNTITAQIRNFTATPANNVRVCFGVYVFSNNGDRFFELGCTMTAFGANEQKTVSIDDWTPSKALLPEGFPVGDNLHTCIKVSVDYAYDTNFANNEMQRNTSVATASLARVPFRLENNLTETAEIELKVEHDTEWRVRVTDGEETIDRPVFAMAPEDCPKDLVVEVEPPPGAQRGDKGLFVVRAVANGEIDFGGVVFEGVVEHVDQGGKRPGELPWVWLIAVLVAVLVGWIVLQRHFGRPRG